MTHIMTIASHPNNPKTNRFFANPFKWIIKVILRADKSYRDRQHVMRLSHRELKDVGLKWHDNHLVTMSRNDLPFITPNDFD